MGFTFKNTLWVLLSFVAIFITVILFRPLLPIDETRYVSVAWEMFLRHDWLAPLTMNGEPYHHKPPLLFWLINIVWAITGPSRWSATIPPIMAGMASVYLTTHLAQHLFKDQINIIKRLPFIMMGCLPFLLYSSMVMFDVTLTVFVLATFILLIEFSISGKRRYIILMALMLGLGVLTKGPVAYLYVIFPMLLGPVWHTKYIKPTRWYGACVITVLLSVIPVLLWLIPVLQHSDSHFAFWLLWEQTAGRVTGNFNDAHVRPFYFYLPIIPLLMIPWIFFAPFWAGLKTLRFNLHENSGLKFLLCWIVPVFISFSLISGKQPHYLVPLIPGMMIMIAYWLQNLDLKTIQQTTACLILVFLTVHIIGSQTFLKDYDLLPVAQYVEDNPDQDWAFVKKYHGELTFLAHRQKAIDVLTGAEDVPQWFAQHPSGKVIMRYKNKEEVQTYKEIFSIPYRGKTIGVFER